MKTFMMALGAVALLGGCASRAEEEPPMAASTMDPMSPLAAPGFMMMAASSDQFEIQSSRMALQMSRNAQVRSFAQMMIDHHSRTTAELMSLAQANGLNPPPPTLMPQHQAMLDRIRAAAPGDFDAAYKREQIASHEEALSLMRNYSTSGDLPPFRDFAARTSPIIEQHLSQAQALPEYMAPMAPQPARAGERG